MTIIEIREWLAFVLEGIIALYVVREFYYDKDKDDKKSRRTRTTKKTTTAPTGEIVVEEHTETTESKGNGNEKA